MSLLPLISPRALQGIHNVATQLGKSPRRSSNSESLPSPGPQSTGRRGAWGAEDAGVLVPAGDDVEIQEELHDTRQESQGLVLPVEVLVSSVTRNIAWSAVMSRMAVAGRPSGHCSLHRYRRPCVELYPTGDARPISWRRGRGGCHRRVGLDMPTQSVDIRKGRSYYRLVRCGRGRGFENKA